MKKALRETQTLRALAVVRFGHRPLARCHKPTDGTDYNTLRRSWLSRSVIRSRDPGHAQLGVVLWSLRREAPSCMYAPNLKQIALCSKVIRGSQISPCRRPPSRGRRTAKI